MPHPPLSLVILLTQFRGVEFLPRRQGANGPKKFKRFHGVMEEALAEQLKNQELSILENKSQKGGCYYTAIPRVVKQKCLCGEDLTRLNLDKIQLLESILMKEYGGDEDALLAELQFAFIAFLPLHSRNRLFTKSQPYLLHDHRSLLLRGYCSASFHRLTVSLSIDDL